ncbi:L-type lectin-domain containing receptor kinase IX.1-like [Rutidosis leptorrhynchoides]|uniref:L-type lectin-domain containing receptor kinase IX.1-like n=1 Tax=Rutidosis leptorrhynchoides TaxID=125765 RepID=UPI003A9A0A7A
MAESSNKFDLVAILFTIIFPSVISVSFEIAHFEYNQTNVVYRGDAEASDGYVQMNLVTHISQIGQMIYADKVRLWDSSTGKLSNFSTHFRFWINTLGNNPYSEGIAFFLGPVGFQIPMNSAGGLLGLFNKTTVDSPKKEIVMVEFDTYNNPESDPVGVGGHVGININSIHSTAYVPWNVSLHDRDKADVWITYESTTKNLSVKWTYQTTDNPIENSSLSLQIDLRQVLPEWVVIGFSAATGPYVEQHVVSFWEFSSSLESEEKSPKRLTIIIVMAAVSTGVTIVTAAIVAMILKRKWLVENQTSEATINNYEFESLAGPRRFSYEELVLATKNFSNERRLGRGGFGTVYMGLLPNVNMEAAVKRISNGSKQGKKEYMAEVKIISQLRHRNLVQLIGWCHERGELLLVYEYMPNGSLDSHLFGKRAPLSWEVRHKIALGLASALLYLHEDWEKCVVHRDIKSSNLMLDSNFIAKLGDFGLARLVDHEQGPQTTNLAGTFGYMAPECLITCRTCKESDVYSFGVVLLEIASGRWAISYMEEAPHYGLVGWVWDLYGREQLHLAADGKLNNNFDQTQVERLLIVGLWCAHPDFRQRATIRQAIQVLNCEAALPDLPTMIPVPTFQVPKSIESASTSQLSNATMTDSSSVVGR